MLLENFRPRSKLVTKTTLVPLPKFPVIDAHNHLGAEFGGGWDTRPVSELLDILASVQVTRYVDLDGGWGETLLQQHLDHFKAAAPDCFQVFGGIDWQRWADLGDSFPEWAAKRLEVQKGWGAEGLKIWKPIGLQVKDHRGVLVDVDDPRLDPIWQAAGELELPVMVHVADPVAFFDPINGSNERWEEIGAYPDWAYTSPPFPPFLHILDGFRSVVRKHKKTIFIGAHVGCYAENLGYVSDMLDECPNYFIDISARLGELGRQPYTARKFFITYQDRILFGTDSSPFPEAYRLYYRFLETDDEYFNYSLGDTPLQGRWHVCGLYLPDEVLEKVYNRNAGRILGIK